MLHELKLFIGSSFGHWGTIFFGTLASVLLIAYPYIVTDIGHPEMSEHFPQWLVYVVVGWTLFWAFFLTWRTEHRSATSAADELKKLSSPQLNVSIDRFGVGSIHEIGGITLHLIASVSNTGAPSIADGFKIKILLANGRSYELDMWVNGNHPIHIQHEQITLADMIFEKVISHPINSGAKIRGYLFAMPKAQDRNILSRDVVLMAGNTIEITCVDVKGNIVKGIHTVDGSGTDIAPYVVGTR